MKKVLNVIVIILIMISLVKVLNFIDNNEYKKAITRCESQDNVVINYTNQGDKYYTCQVEK